MTRRIIRFLAASALAAAATVSTPLPTRAAPEDAFPTSTCLWTGPYQIDERPDLNIAFPDTGAVYWSADVAIPAGARLDLAGRYAHGRYVSFNSYSAATGAPTDAIRDVDIAPDPGSDNPFLPGARRTVNRRDYTVSILNALPPVARAANTLYAAVPGQARQALIYRVYVPDKNRDLTGGVGLPVPVLTLADGTVISGDAACAALTSGAQPLGALKLPLAQYLAFRDQPGKPPTFPAENPPVFRRAFNINHVLSCLYGIPLPGSPIPCGGTPVLNVGQYANLDNAYLYAQTNRGFGEVLVLRGRAPTTPPTWQRNPKMEGGTQLRYWSICQNESFATTRVADCLYDEQIPLDEDGFYTVVTSRPEDRPRNAVERCGVAWLPVPENGDGVGAPNNHPDDGLLIIRNMLPPASFPNAIQNVAFPNTEASVMGDYLLEGEYTSRDAFEALGCDPSSRMRP
jgi:hypothetical protein